MSTWRAALLGLLLGAAVSAAGCAAPTLPIPPPTALISAPDATGLVTVSGSADPAAYVFVLHEETQDGLITHADALGAYSVRLPAAVGDMITVWQLIGTQASQQEHLVVPP